MSRVYVNKEENHAGGEATKHPPIYDDSNNSFTSPTPGADENNQSPRRPCSIRRWIGRTVMLCLLILGVTAGLSLILRGTANPFDLFKQPDLPTAAETERWESSGFRGLTLPVENALEDKWTAYFEEYVSQWDRGSPDALTLTTSRGAVDSSCQPSPGILKVCNGNYGPTDWNGINLRMMQNGYIVMSVSKMNDYFLDSLSEDEKRYTMCHEIGHGFGLEHTDENYGNANLGNCLDYAFNVKGNLSPGTFNYELLAKVYGTVPPIRRRLGGPKEIPESVMARYHEISEEIATSTQHECFHQKCVQDLGDGYTLDAHKLKHH